MVARIAGGSSRVVVPRAGPDQPLTNGSTARLAAAEQDQYLVDDHAQAGLPAGLGDGQHLLRRKICRVGSWEMTVSTAGNELILPSERNGRLPRD